MADRSQGSRAFRGEHQTVIKRSAIAEPQVVSQSRYKYLPVPFKAVPRSGQMCERASERSEREERERTRSEHVEGEDEVSVVREDEVSVVLQSARLNWVKVFIVEGGGIYCNVIISYIICHKSL